LPLPKENVPFTVEEKSGFFADQLAREGPIGGEYEGRANRLGKDLQACIRVRYTLVLELPLSRIWRRGCKIRVVNEWPSGFCPTTQFQVRVATG
jgi:hypothetical protein